MLPEWTVPGGASPTNPWRDTFTGRVTRVRALGSYSVDRRAGVRHAAQRAAHVACGQLDSPQLRNGRSQPALCRHRWPDRHRNLIEPGLLYGDRVNQIDPRFAKIVRTARTRTSVGFDVFNVTNSAPVLTCNQTFVPTTTWLRPDSVLQPRFVKFSARIDF